MTQTQRNAFTLIEVVAGLVLMGSLVAAGLVALASHQRSILFAKQKILAHDVAERLLTGWYELRGDIPTRDQGIVVEKGYWIWRTQPVLSRAVCGMPVHIIRLEILGTVGNSDDTLVLSSVELLQSQNASAYR